jgi:hypothetical protein
LIALSRGGFSLDTVWERMTPRQITGWLFHARRLDNRQRLEAYEATSIGMWGDKKVRDEFRTALEADLD